MSKSFVLFCAFLALGISLANAACKTSDAKWKRNSRGPTINQPNRNDPSTVTVSWGDILENKRCVDQFNIYYWKKGESKAQARKVNLKGHTITSKVVTIESCVEYSFEVELIEKDWTHTDRLRTKTTK